MLLVIIAVAGYFFIRKSGNKELENNPIDREVPIISESPYTAVSEAPLDILFRVLSLSSLYERSGLLAQATIAAPTTIKIVVFLTILLTS